MVDCGADPTYWSPAHDGSLIRDDASRPVYGVTMQRAEQNAFVKKGWSGLDLGNIKLLQGSCRIMMQCLTPN